MNQGIAPTLRCDCEQRDLQAAYNYCMRPERETSFPISGAYERRYDFCNRCGHFFGRHNMDLSALYDGDYLDATYGDAARMRASYERIIALPDGRSDNRARVRRVNDFMSARSEAVGRRLLDIGAGLGVFCHGMVAAGWSCTAFDTDRRFADHISAILGIETVTGDFLLYPMEKLGVFDLVALNKVLEHVEDPVGILAKAGLAARPGGIIYLEVPDGEAASPFGQDREEFFIEHHHVFSPASVTATVERAGLRLLRLERLHEPSDKYSLAIFAAPVEGGT